MKTFVPSPGLLMLCFLALPSCGWGLFVEQRGDRDELEPGQDYWFELDATRRSGLIIQKDNRTMVLSEPAPDTALSRDTDLLATLVADITSDTTGRIEGEGKVRVIETVTELKARQESVLVLREALYRLSELAFNGYLDEEEVDRVSRRSMGLAEVSPLPRVTTRNVPLDASRAARVQQMFFRTLDAIELALGSGDAPGTERTARETLRVTSSATVRIDKTQLTAGQASTVRITLLRNQGRDGRLGLEVTNALITNLGSIENLEPTTPTADSFSGVILSGDGGTFDVSLRPTDASTTVSLTVRYNDKVLGNPLILDVVTQ